MRTLTGLSRLIGVALAVITAVVTVVTLIGMITSRNVRDVTKHHSYAISLIAMLVLLILIITLWYVIILRQRNIDLTSKISSAENGNDANDHDRRLFQEVICQIPPDGELMVWLKGDFMIKAMPSRMFDILYNTVRYIDRTPIGFDTKEIESARNGLRDGLDELVDVASAHLRNDGLWLTLPSDLPGHSQVVDALSHAHSQAVAEYDKLHRIAHENGLD